MKLQKQQGEGSVRTNNPNVLASLNLWS